MDNLLPTEEDLEALDAAEYKALCDGVTGLVPACGWLPNSGAQEDAYFCKADVLLYGGSAGGGKGLRKQELILTPFGWKAIGKLKVGSAICATDGSVQRIIGYYERGIQPLYKLTWSDGSETVCDSDHIWLGSWSKSARKIRNKITHGEDSASKWVAKDIFARFTKSKLGGQRLDRFGISPMESPCAFNVHGEARGGSRHISRKIPPYVLGVLLGDGCITGKSISFTPGDVEIADRVEVSLKNAYGTDVYISRRSAKDDANRAYGIPKDLCYNSLVDLGLIGKGSLTKFIPRIYLLATVEERWELLRGLMDTDGWADKDGDIYYCTVSERLKNDVTHLCRSLGATVTCRVKDPFYTDADGNKVVCNLAYSLRIKLPIPEMAFCLERKRNVCLGKRYQSHILWLDNIEEYGNDETVCISVSHKNSLFVINNFIVTHNSDLLAGLALTAHRRSLIMRREYVDLGDLIDRFLAINGTRDGFNGSPPPRLSTKDGRLIRFGACSKPGDEAQWQGFGRDLLGLDEAALFQEFQVRFLMGWLRSASETQRQRVVFCSNPPMSSDGEWMIKMFRPWLDVTHPNPAKAGELRWYVSDPDGNDMEVESNAPIEVGGKMVKPKSRTFIPARLKDNPYLVKTDYESTLDAMPEPLRSAMRDGNFMIARKDDEWQVMPSEWVAAAQRRWTQRPPEGSHMTSMGVDVAQGGSDDSTLARHYNGWFAPLVTVAGKLTPLGSDLAALIVSNRRDNAEIVIDFGGGYGGAPALRLRDNDIAYVAFKGSAGSSSRTRDGKLRFVNKRAAAWWKLREALDPDQIGGSPVMLPPGSGLMAQLCAPRFKMAKAGIQIEDKAESKKRLGGKIDEADAIVMAWNEGKYYSVDGGVEHRAGVFKRAYKVVMGHEGRRRK